ncbi:hypothetical protein PSCICJ_22690 [Pseudomonas cichorii]|nr:hypothetical protein PSCICJ_22690 [Pseudomonas cichorii]
MLTHIRGRGLGRDSQFRRLKCVAYQQVVAAKAPPTSDSYFTIGKLVVDLISDNATVEFTS